MKAHCKSDKNTFKIKKIKYSSSDILRFVIENVVFCGILFDVEIDKIGDVRML